jgi:hypothetical protein
MLAQVLSPADSAFFSNLQSVIQPTPAKFAVIDSIYRIPLARMQQIDKEMNRIARQDLPQSEKDAQFNLLRAEKKKLKENREISILLELTASEQALYKSAVIPTKPAVLHMGSNHDRAACTVCIKPK